MQTEQTQNELIIRETPGCLWIVGLFFAFVGGIFVYGALGGLVDYGSQSPWMLAAAFVMGSIGVGVGIWIIYKAPITKIVINRIEDSVLMTRYGLFGKQESFYHFDEIENFSLIAGKDDEGSDIWSVGMNLANGETITITSLASHYEEYERRYIFQTNEFMRKQMPPTEMILELEDESDEEMQ